MGRRMRIEEATMVFALVSAGGCLDLTLLDEVRPPGAESDTDGASEGANGESSGTSTPVKNADDNTPPAVVVAVCAAEEREEQGVCISEGAAGASFRFETDEPASATLTGPEGSASRLFSEAWATAHHAGLFGLGDTDTPVTLILRDINGNEGHTDIVVAAMEGTPVAITEVLADPVGAEPAQELIEIVNFGSAVEDLSGWMIDDNGDANGDVLPDGTSLSPGQIAVLASPSYNPESPGEPSLAADALLILLGSSVASNGLKNSEAETIELYDASGALVSRYLGQAGAPKEGVSAVRIAPGLPDGDPLAFVQDPSGTSTPGWIDEPQ